MFMPPLAASPSEFDAPAGDTYGIVLISARDEAFSIAVGSLRSARFSGWVAPPRDGWLVVVGDPGAGVVADGRRGMIEVGRLLAGAQIGPVLAVVVRRDRQLGLVAWREGAEVARYCSDPSQDPEADKDVLSSPVGSDAGEALAVAFARQDAGERLVEHLEEELEPDSTNESERLASVLRLLGAPVWVVAAASLPRDLPRGPRTRELLRLRVGRTGIVGRMLASVVAPLRRRHIPPPVIEDPPRGHDDAAMYGLW
jgi:hypothetical protein